MNVSYNWLNKYFDGTLPSPEAIAEALTFHSWEVEEVRDIEGDTVFDINILPDKSMWALSHRGVAKDLSVILDLPMVNDPLLEPVILTESEPEIGIVLDTPHCRRFAAVRVTGIKVGPSPKWLQDALEAIGQRSINNIVDASNYVMYDLGQPSHAFDAKRVGDAGLLVRAAKAGESLVGLDEQEYTFETADTVIARADTDEVLSIAGIKGGLHSGVEDSTTDIILEVANWDPVAIRKTAQRLKLRSDASRRYENGIVPEMVPVGLHAALALILEVAGGEVAGLSEVVTTTTSPRPVTVPLSKVNSVLGISLTTDDVDSILQRFGYAHEWAEDVVTVTPPFERSDLAIPEDLIEEIGRVHGLSHVPSIVPEPVPLTEFNKQFFYAEIIRKELTERGFSEVFTSSFRSKDVVQLANAFASDKGYLRSNLRSNLTEALERNISHRDLLGLQRIAIFEIGTVFSKEEEHLSLALGVRTNVTYKPKQDDPVLTDAIAALSDVLGNETFEVKDGVAEVNLTEAISDLPEPTAYAPYEKDADVSYRPFSPYPAVARDIALWVHEGTGADEVVTVLNGAAGDLRVRTTLFDEFEKDGRKSYAFRLVFQSGERTLTDDEVNAVMEAVYAAALECGWEVR
ncbi:MAG: phenylalanine--tRNA ligase subunit beta [Candidatus Paceibacterota bacterium]